MQIRTSFALASCLVTALAIGTLNSATQPTAAATAQPTFNGQPPSGQPDIAHRGSGRIESIRRQSAS